MKSARRRAGRDLGWWFELPLVVVGAEAEEDVDIETAVCDLENPEVDLTEDVGRELEVERGGDLERVPIVAVFVLDGVGWSLSDWGMGIEDVAAGSGESNDPDISLNPKKAEYEM